ncbi:MAG: hypothetical protein ACYSWZ_21795 [Planctomycetota bacterium]
MSRALQKYLDHIMVYTNRNEKDTAQIRKELEDHLLKKIADLQTEGLSHEDAVFGAIEDHGHPRTVGYGLRKHQWIDIRTRGTARGFIAIGPKAVGTIAIGGFALGVELRCRLRFRSLWICSGNGCDRIGGYRPVVIRRDCCRR